MTARKVGLILFAIWALVFVLGAVGELFGIEALRDALDFKRIFLR